jgi:hypothetical protein
MQAVAQNLEHAGPSAKLYGAAKSSVGQQVTVPRAATIPPLQREIFGFAFGNSSLADSTYGYPAWSFNLLTTIAYFGLTIDWDGTIIQSGSGWTTWNSSALTGLISTAHANRDRVIVSVNLHSFTPRTGPSPSARSSRRSRGSTQTASTSTTKATTQPARTRSERLNTDRTSSTK